MSNQTTKPNYRVFPNSIFASNDIIEVKNHLLKTFLEVEEMKNRVMTYYKKTIDLKKEIEELKKINHDVETLEGLKHGDYEIENFIDFLMEIKGVREYLNKNYFTPNK